LPSNIKTSVEKTKAFIKEHKTLVACSVTAVVASAITYNVSTAHVVKKVTEFVYDKGHEFGHVCADLEIANNFIVEQGLESEFIDFAQIPVA
jgi:hypothetical protein